ncbi:tyrosine-type recombinase/integrase [Arthrobacter sp. AOP36-A1-22]|uniref:tyrosine-type recombinase/integrase n=1 Tax=Arthrobacter sp. AOP36-A1-22 TaxID=3457684 RepID=UPI0040339B41
MTSALDTTDPTTDNADRHAALIAGWALSLGSPNTRRAYGRDLGSYLGWLDRSALDLLTVSRVHVDAYREHLGSITEPRALSAATVARKLSALSGFYAYAVSADALTSNPAALVKRPTVDADTSDTQGLTKDQARELYAAAVEDGPRSRALVALLLTSGIRVSEALGATTADYGHDSGYRVLTVTRKGGKRAKVVLSGVAVEALDAYLETTGHELVAGSADAAPIFTTATGKTWASSEAFRTVQRLAKVAGIAGRISPHSLRHTFATIHLDAGGTLHDLQDSMGHADPRTTRRYDRARGNLAKSATHTVTAALAL